VCGLCFLPFLLLSPLAQLVPAAATAPALLLTGLYMFRAVPSLPLERLEEGVPAYATLLLIPLTSSIALGILWGFVLHVVLFVLARRGRELTVGMWALAATSAVALWIDHAHRA
jgi:AGZA family xanthine/uracil permease-like MFS transporter